MAVCQSNYYFHYDANNRCVLVGASYSGQKTHCNQHNYYVILARRAEVPAALTRFSSKNI